MSIVHISLIYNVCRTHFRKLILSSDLGCKANIENLDLVLKHLDDIDFTYIGTMMLSSILRPESEILDEG